MAKVKEKEGFNPNDGVSDTNFDKKSTILSQKKMALTSEARLHID